MPKLDNNQIKGIQKLLTLLEPDALTRKEFKENFAKVIKFLTSLKEKNQGEFENLNQKFSDQSEKLSGDNTTNLTELKAEFTKLIDKALKDQEDGMNFIRDKVRKIREGTDGYSPIKGVDYFDGKPGKDGAPGKDAPVDTPRQAKKKIKLLKKKLKIKDIKNLRKELDELRGSQTVHSLSGGSGGIGGHVRYYDLSSKLNGVLKTFSLPAFARILSVQSSSFPNAFRETTDYVVDGSLFTIEFTSEINASSTLAAGQTITILYANQ